MSGGQKGPGIVTVCLVFRSFQQLSQYVRWPHVSSSCRSRSGGQKGPAFVTLCLVVRRVQQLSQYVRWPEVLAVVTVCRVSRMV
jgi:hypothetical protein